jgi:hypothetical protein
MTKADKLSAFHLRQFTGTENRHRFGINPKVLSTDGAKYVADEGGAYWLLVAIAIAKLFEKSVSGEAFQVWTLKVKKDRTASLICDDGNDTIFYTQHFAFTDFPIDEIRLYFTDGTILLPSKY